MMGKRSHQFKVESLGKFLLYVLGRRPDEFGLVPDREGFFSFKALLGAVHEEPGWSFVRRSHINETLLGKDRHLFEIDGNRIRATEIKWKFDPDNAEKNPPTLLFLPIRRKAHPVVMEKGLMLNIDNRYVLAADKGMALRIGKRRDPKPVVLEITALKAAGRGVSFNPFGCLFLSSSIPAEFIAGPPVSKEVMETLRSHDIEKKEKGMPVFDFEPGTFTLDAARDPDRYRRAKGKKPRGWKEEARKQRRGKSI